MAAKPKILSYEESRVYPPICNVCWTTITGRITSPTPKSLNRKFEKKWGHWHIIECVKEAEFRGDEWNLIPLKAILERIESKKKWRCGLSDDVLYEHYLMTITTPFPNGVFLLERNDGNTTKTHPTTGSQAR